MASNYMPNPYIQRLADGGSVGTGDPHLDKVLDEVMSHMIGTHPDPEGSAMHYLDLLMPGSLEGYQHSGQYPGMAGGGDVGDATDGGSGMDMDALTGGGQGAHEGILSGPDGGMDDSVQAQSDDGSPVALSHGEYVVPADVVAMLGDGNTDAGAQMLDQFIQSVRQAKYSDNKGEQPPQTPDDVFSSLMGQPGQGQPPGGAPPEGSPEEEAAESPDQEAQEQQQGPPPGMAEGGDVDYTIPPGGDQELQDAIRQNERGMLGSAQIEQLARRMANRDSANVYFGGASPNNQAVAEDYMNAQGAHAGMQGLAEAAMAQRRMLAARHARANPYVGPLPPALRGAGVR